MAIGASIVKNHDVPYLVILEWHCTAVDEHVMSCAAVGMGNEASCKGGITGYVNILSIIIILSTTRHTSYMVQILYSNNVGY